MASNCGSQYVATCFLCAIVIAISFSFGCSRATDGCSSDDQCKGDRVCVNEKCQDPEKREEATDTFSKGKEVGKEKRTELDSERKDIADEGLGNEKDILFQSIRGLYGKMGVIQGDESVACERRQVDLYLFVTKDAEVRRVSVAAKESEASGFLEEAIAESNEVFLGKTSKDCPTGPAGLALAAQLDGQLYSWEEAEKSWVDKSGLDLPLAASDTNAFFLEIEKANIEALRKKKTKKKFTISGGFMKSTVTFNVKKTKVSKKWPFDRNGNSWFEREANKNSKYLYVDFDVTSKNEIPLLPLLVAYKIENGEPAYLGLLDIRYYRWEDYGAYLGNYGDSGNSFFKRDTVRFTAGISIKEEVLKGTPVLIGSLKEPCALMEFDRWRNPPQFYTYKHCMDLIDLNPSIVDLSEELIPVYWKNRKGLKLEPTTKKSEAAKDK